MVFSARQVPHAEPFDQKCRPSRAENVIAPYTKIGEPASAPVAGGWGIRKLD